MAMAALLGSAVRNLPHARSRLSPAAYYFGTVSVVDGRISKALLLACNEGVQRQPQQ
jgi:hypothetical protein